MTRRNLSTLAVLASAAIIACTSDNGSDLPNVVGTWNATAARVTNKTNSSEATDLYAEGARFKVTFNSNNTLEAISTFADVPDTSTGTWSETATVLTFTDTDNTVETYTFSINGATLTMSGGTLTFDFGSGEVPARLDLTLVKQ